jgi:hypothetical protein
VARVEAWSSAGPQSRRPPTTVTATGASSDEQERSATAHDSCVSRADLVDATPALSTGTDEKPGRYFRNPKSATLADLVATRMGGLAHD